MRKLLFCVAPIVFSCGAGSAMAQTSGEAKGTVRFVGLVEDVKELCSITGTVDGKLGVNASVNELSSDLSGGALGSVTVNWGGSSSAKLSVGSETMTRDSDDDGRGGETVEGVTLTSGFGLMAANVSAVNLKAGDTDQDVWFKAVLNDASASFEPASYVGTTTVTCELGTVSDADAGS